MIRKFQVFFADESAATSIEYALIAGGLSIVIVAAVNSVGTTLNATFTSVSAQLKQDTARRILGAGDRALQPITTH